MLVVRASAKRAHRFIRPVLLSGVVLLSSCASLPPQSPDNLCHIFEEKYDWYEAAIDAKERWGVPVHIPMAIMHQESSFRHDAAPPMQYFLWFIPVGRASDAYGYPQAKDAVWAEYQQQSGNTFADRDDFEDAIDFIAWYMDRTARVNKVSKWDAYAQYLNYHEGQGGYRRGSYERKPWLKSVARKVATRAKRYSEQFWACKEELGRNWLSRWLF